MESAKKTWTDLDRLLQFKFKSDTYKNRRSATININEYEMDVNEIVEVAEKQGYKVEVKKSGHIEFTD